MSNLMPRSETIQKFALQGPFSVVQLVLIGLAIAAIMAFLAWRWARDSGSWKKSAFLLALRLGALGVALWMLAGASTVTVRRDTRAKSVIFMVDSSASMGMADPVDGSGETVRWTGSETNLRASPPVLALDEVIGTLQSARSDVARLRLLAESGDPDQHGQILWDQIHRSVVSAADGLGPLVSSVTRADAEAGAELDRVAAFLKGNAAPMGSWRIAGAKSPEDRLDEAGAFLTAAMQRIERQSQGWPPPTKRIPPARTNPDWPSNPSCREMTRWPDGWRVRKNPGSKMSPIMPASSATPFLLKFCPWRATIGARSCAPTTTRPPVPPIWPPPSIRIILRYFEGI